MPFFKPLKPKKKAEGAFNKKMVDTFKKRDGMLDDIYGWQNNVQPDAKDQFPNLRKKKGKR